MRGLHWQDSQGLDAWRDSLQVGIPWLGRILFGVLGGNLWTWAFQRMLRDTLKTESGVCHYFSLLYGILEEVTMGKSYIDIFEFIHFRKYFFIQDIHRLIEITNLIFSDMNFEITRIIE